jgi:excisionase family DNA binding protein
MLAQAVAEQLIPIAQAARTAGLSYSTVRRLVSQGRIPSVRVCGIPRVRLSAVLAAIEER